MNWKQEHIHPAFQSIVYMNDIISMDDVENKSEFTLKYLINNLHSRRVDYENFRRVINDVKLSATAIACVRTFMLYQRKIISHIEITFY